MREDGVMHEGIISTQLGLPGNPDLAESAMVHRDLELAEFTGARLHVPHVSSAKAVQHIRHMKKRNKNSETLVELKSSLYKELTSDCNELFQEVVEGINKAKKHMRPTQENPQGGIVEKELSVHLSNLSLVHKGKKVKVGFKMLENGKKVRINKLNGSTID